MVHTEAKRAHCDLTNVGAVIVVAAIVVAVMALLSIHQNELRRQVFGIPVTIHA